MASRKNHWSARMAASCDNAVISPTFLTQDSQASIQVDAMEFVLPPKPVAVGSEVNSSRQDSAKENHNWRFATSLCKWTLVTLALLTNGCVGYQLGPRAMFRPDIRTVHVPIVRNETFRHDLGVRMSEAIVRRIQDRTPYIVTGDPNADSVLTCRFVSVGKQGLTETETDELRAFDTTISVDASWVGRNGAVLMENRFLPTGNLALTFGQQTRVVPEAGQSFEVEVQAAIDDLADRVVAQMEARW